MAYRQNGHYPPSQSPQQPFPPPGTPPQQPYQHTPQQPYQHTPQQPYQHTPQVYPQVVIPVYPPHLAQSPLLQPPLRPHDFTTPAPSLPQHIPPHYSAPPHTSFQYGGVPAASGSPYGMPNRHPDPYISPHPLYPATLPPRSQTQPSPRPSQPIVQRQASQPISPQIQTLPQPQRYSQLAPQPSPTIQSAPHIHKPSKAPSSQSQTRPSPHMSGSKVLPRQRQGGNDNTKPAVDYQVLLLALADEYLDAAHSQATLIAVSQDEQEMEQYYKLVATGLRCMEALLKNWRLAPQTEALVTLRFAKILYEETNNDTKAETILSKGIDLCERNRMFDLKYGMQQLLCRILAKSNPKAAMKTVDGVIRDIEAYRHTGWEYVFRLLRASISLSQPPHQDLVGALHNLQKTSSLATSCGDKAVSVIAAVLEALIYLQQSTSTDSIEHAQRAIATARSRQLDPEVHSIPQLSSVIQMIDICCSILEYDINQSSQKLKGMQTSMDQDIHNPKWKDDGSFALPLSARTIESASPREHRNDGHTFELTMNWLPEHDLYALCYFLSSITLSAKNSQDGHKAEKYLQEGLGMMKASLSSPQGISESLMSSSARIHWRRNLYCNMLLQQVFLYCSRTEWRTASKTLKEVRSTLAELGESANDDIKCLAEYARGIIYQATGDTGAAMAIYRQPMFSLAQSTNKTSRSNPHRDTSILANLNIVLLLRDPSKADHPLASETLSIVGPHCQSSPNKYIRAAYSLISATVHTDSTIQTKRDLHQALQAATAIQNSQITCVALTFMSWKYFRGVIGEQSEKSAMAARAMARKADDKLWMSVTDDLLAETLDRQGKSMEAEALRAKADRKLETLPPALKMTWGDGNGNGKESSNGGATKIRPV
ncbi:75k gamma secalin [Microsporum canis CBS 113480]|uniref:75k gamma secalin n=1 Tax=Arthroderma otae (strain ATCC MYA-4605 / CBS 113480) TaxID=554155 RepID=C5FKX0_ARTOC|nr:75k gamma secalin [Microsporum canis CBS 113480]EEQ30342.1 75k gamma secalin [Microsporum canis CBS 113480]